MNNWHSMLCIGSGDIKCYYTLDPIYQIVAKINSRLSGKKTLLHIVSVIYNNVEIIQGLILIYAPEPYHNILIPLFLRKNIDIKNNIHYNVSLILNSTMEDFKLLSLSEKQQKFEAACLLKNITWRT